MDAPKQSKQLPLEQIYTQSLPINYVLSSQYSPFLCRQIDVVFSPMMMAKWND